MVAVVGPDYRTDVAGELMIARVISPWKGVVVAVGQGVTARSCKETENTVIRKKTSRRSPYCFKKKSAPFG
ncbi:unnamed protein product [Heligmosomoides polygyrus]|uniref:Pyr_redox_2 domain-containing protein n=1 Tax=Heligmosomoides polygyrus TaxID=6339 RepID=A0A183FQ12_HELPZ|nr:unnamed protein product [Heligmosomoides polygyrus]